MTNTQLKSAGSLHSTVCTFKYFFRLARLSTFSIHFLRELRDIALDCTVAPDEPLN